MWHWSTEKWRRNLIARIIITTQHVQVWPSKRDIGQLRIWGDLAKIIIYYSTHAGLTKQAWHWSTDIWRRKTCQDYHLLLNMCRLDQASVTLVNWHMKAKNLPRLSCTIQHVQAWPSKRDLGQPRNEGGTSLPGLSLLLNMCRLDQVSVTLVNWDMRRTCQEYHLLLNICRLDRASVTLVNWDMKEKLKLPGLSSTTQHVQAWPSKRDIGQLRNRET